jgi:hypothetical protein
MRDASTGVIAWWAALSLVSLGNIAAWIWIASKRWRHWQTALSAVFVFGCAFRSFLPRTEAQRFVLYDSWLSDPSLARIVATLAELSFVAQVALILHSLARDSRAARWISYAMVPLIALAECFSWYTALTTNFAGIGFAQVRGRFRPYATAAGILYVGFMCTVDVPMYVHRYLHDQRLGKSYLSVAQGWSDSWKTRIVTLRWEDWRQEMPWMSLYFSACVWLSLMMAGSHRTEEPSQ